jgi:hypothetical protein
MYQPEDLQDLSVVNHAQLVKDAAESLKDVDLLADADLLVVAVNCKNDFIYFYLVTI